MSSQEVPQGYKKTKVGIVPEEWKEIILSSFVNEKVVYCNDEEIDLGSLTIEKGVVPKPARYNREHLVKDTNDAYKLIETNDFAYNPMNLRFGALALYKNKQQLKVSAYYNIFNVNEDIVNLDYIYAYLKSERIMFYCNKMATGSLEEKKRVHFKEFNKFIFPIPTIKEQQKIANILTTWDNAVSKQNELIKAKEELKKGLMQKLLSGEVRFDEFNEEWKDKKIGNIGTTYNGLTGKTAEDFINGNSNFITYKNIFNNTRIKTSIFETVSITTTEKQNKAKYGDIFFTISSETPEEVGMSSVLLDDINNIYLNSFCFGYRLDNFDILLPEFARFYFRSFGIRGKIMRLAQGSTRFNLSKTEVMKIKIKLPLIQEQQKIAEVLTNADKEIDLLKNELEELKKQKKGLMQKLLTGEVRVKV